MKLYILRESYNGTYFYYMGKNKWSSSVKSAKQYKRISDAKSAIKYWKLNQVPRRIYQIWEAEIDPTFNKLVYEIYNGRG